MRATLPAVRAHIETITGLFYDTMLTERPELLQVFSRSAQATGAQRQALDAVDAQALDLHLEHHVARHIARQDDVAAPAEHELGPSGQLRIGQHGQDIAHCAHAHQGVRARRDAEGIPGLQRDVFLDYHWLDCRTRPLWRAPRTTVSRPFPRD